MEEQGFVYFRQPLEDGGIGGKLFAHLDECTDDIHAHGDSAVTIKDTGGHQRAMLGENTREFRASAARGFRYRILRYQNREFLTVQQKSEVIREAFEISLNGFIEATGGDAVYRSQLGIEDNLLAAKIENGNLRDTLHADQFSSIQQVWIELSSPNPRNQQ
jgi:hypothetical protein